MKEKKGNTSKKDTETAMICGGGGEAPKGVTVLGGHCHCEGGL